MIRIAETTDLKKVLQITRDTISEIYSHYYPKGVVDFSATSQQRKGFIRY